MNQFSKQNENKTKHILFMVMFFLMAFVGTAFGQVVQENESNLNSTLTTDVIETSVVKQEESTSNSNMNFVLWFMSSKQDPNAKIAPSGINTKKQIMTSGAAPNRLLIKAFLKKAVNFESALV
ncbi:MAG: hypothetical protein KA264_10605 [Crocinitomicaceae bacterium]|nr:hypothetical protein [Crocinitomicaceae bacterium]